MDNGPVLFEVHASLLEDQSQVLRPGRPKRIRDLEVSFVLLSIVSVAERFIHTDSQPPGFD